MTIVFNFDGRIDPQRNGNFLDGATGTMNDQRHILEWFDARFDSQQVKSLAAIEPQRRGAGLISKLAGQNTHAYQIAPMNTLKTLSNNGFHAE